MGINASVKKYLTYLYKNAEAQGEFSIEKVLRKYINGGAILDVGCWDGVNTLRWAKAMDASHIFGLELVPSAVKKARKRGVRVYKADLESKWPIKSDSVNCVVSNLVIEHMKNVDFFITESYRVLKKGGYTVVSTNNLASWHNLLSLILGWAPFDLSNTSQKHWSIGNPLALHSTEVRDRGDTYMHKCVYTTKWLKEWYSLYGFKFVKHYAAGYYPFPSFFSNFDKIHAALITLLFKK